MIVSFRPHHFLCTLCFQGKGYSPEFIQNFQTIIDYLTAHPDDAAIHVTPQTDAICAPCPHRRQQQCTSQEKINQLDQAHQAALGIQPGDSLSWNEAKQKISDRLSLKKFHQICAKCEWKQYGMCESAIQDFLRLTKA